jgi:hypothetical protein
MAIMVRPWNASSNAMIPCRPVWARAILIACLYGFRAGIQQECFLGKFSRSERIQPLSKFDIAFVRRDLYADVQKAI